MARRGTFKAVSVRSPRAEITTTPSESVLLHVLHPWPQRPWCIIPFNNIVKVSDVELLEKLEGGGVVCEDDGLAVMYEADI